MSLNPIPLIGKSNYLYEYTNPVAPEKTLKNEYPNDIFTKQEVAEVPSNNTQAWKVGAGVGAGVGLLAITAFCISRARGKAKGASKGLKNVVGALLPNAEPTSKEVAIAELYRFVSNPEYLVREAAKKDSSIRPSKVMELIEKYKEQDAALERACARQGEKIKDLEATAQELRDGQAEMEQELQKYNIEGTEPDAKID